jgi:hypothetical protein
MPKEDLIGRYCLLKVLDNCVRSEALFAECFVIREVRDNGKTVLIAKDGNVYEVRRSEINLFTR